jgi:hypothetical protein
MIHYPENVVRHMRPQIERAFDAAMHHFQLRHDGRGFRPPRAWIAEVRRLDAASGYSEALKMLRGAK